MKKSEFISLAVFCSFYVALLVLLQVPLVDLTKHMVFDYLAMWTSTADWWLVFGVPILWGLVNLIIALMGSRSCFNTQQSYALTWTLMLTSLVLTLFSPLLIIMAVYQMVLGIGLFLRKRRQVV